MVQIRGGGGRTKTKKTTKSHAERLHLHVRAYFLEVSRMRVCVPSCVHALHVCKHILPMDPEGMESSFPLFGPLHVHCDVALGAIVALSFHAAVSALRFCMFVGFQEGNGVSKKGIACC